MSAERIGRFRVTGVVGAGGFATVLRAVDDRLEDEVAVKVLAENHSLDPDVRERFLAEGRVLRRIDSPHVVRVLDLGETDRQQPYLVLELADRGDLADRLEALRAEGWSPTVADLLAVIRPLCDALEAVHRAGVVHRDLSPGNLLLRSTLAPDPGAAATSILRDDERLVLADLGLSKDLARSSGLTVAGGTEGFRPPEQRGAPTTVDARADLWSLSALVVWLFAGTAPRDVDHARGLLETTPVPAEAATALGRSLAPAAEDRHADVTSWRHDLLLGLRVPERPTVPPPGADAEVSPAPAPEDVAGRRRPRGRTAGLVAGALLLGLTLGFGVPRVLGGDGGRVEVSEDGAVAVTAERGDLRAVLRGPSETSVGTPATFVAEVSGATGWVWLAPDGQVHAQAGSVTVEPTSAGGATITLVAIGPGGAEVRAVHRLRVREP
ncbi:serine/threonine protein kinase [Nitriliruptoraceae bacterium ZYF776]|nr:serine/threonine protein kinase [Profundirhabdus halotolerans]